MINKAIGQEFYIPQYGETWILKEEGLFPNGEACYNFRVKSSKMNNDVIEIENFHKSEFEKLFIEDVIQ